MQKNTKKEFFIFILIFLLGVFLRLYHLDYPLGLHGDEAWTGIEARRILTQGSIGIWSSSALGQPTLPFYWTAFIFKLFGESIYTLRLSFALLTIFSLPFFYFAVKLLFNKNVALIAFLLFATSHVFLLFSHVAPTHALFLVLFFPTIYFFLLALKSNRKIFFIVSGILLGLAPYFYVGLRIFPLFFAFFISYKSFYKNFLKQYWKNLLLFFLISFTIFLPLGLYGLRHSEDFMTRINMVSVFSKDGIVHEAVPNASIALENNIRKVFLMFLIKGDVDPQDNFHSAPLFEWVSGVFFTIGFLSQLFYRKKHFADDSRIFLLLWFFIFLTGSIFTVDAPNFRRIQPSITASYIFVALGIIYVYRYLKRLLKLSHILNVLMVLVLIIIAWNNISMYFGKQAISSETKSAFSYQLVKAAEFIKTIPDPYVYFYSARWSYNYETLRFLLNDIPGEDRSSQFGTYSLMNNNFGKTVVYLFLPDYQNSLFEVQKMYSNGKTIIKEDTDKTILFYSYIIPKKL